MNDKEIITLPLKVNGLEIKMQPTSPLALAQSNEEVQTAMGWMQIIQQLGPVGQMAVRIDKVADFVADKLGIPADLRTTPEERQQLIEQAQQQAQTMQQQQAAPVTQEEEVNAQAKVS